MKPAARHHPKPKNSLAASSTRSSHPGSTSVAKSFWGEASRDFGKTVYGKVFVASTNSPDSRTLGQVEVPTILANPNVDEFGELPIARVRADQAAHGTSYVTDEVQNAFRADVTSGLFDDHGTPVLSKEIADKFRLTDAHLPAADIRLPLADMSTPLWPPRSSILPPGIDAQAIADRGEAALQDRAAIALHLDPADRAALTAPDPATVPAGSAAPGSLDPELTIPGGADGPATGVTTVEGEAGKFPLGEVIGRGSDALTIAQLGYAAISTAEQYKTLREAGDSFAASDLLRTQAIVNASSTAGTFAGGFVAGAGYTAVVGAEAGPVGIAVAGIAGGVVGGIIGKADGEQIAAYFNDRALDRVNGTDGVTYQHRDGGWQTTHSGLALSIFDGPAPQSQVPYLDMERAKNLVQLEIANPSNLDPNNIEAKNDAGQSVTWQRTGPGQWEGFNLKDFKVEKASPAVTSGLEQQSTLRTAIGPNSADYAAKGFVTQFYGEHWDKLEPLPDSVVTQLHLKSELNVADPSTGITWQVNGNTVSRMAMISQANGQPLPPPQTAETQQTPDPSAQTAPVASAQSAPVASASSPSNGAPELPSAIPSPQPAVSIQAPADVAARVLAARDQAVAFNAAYGQQLTLQQFTALQNSRAAGVPYIPYTTTTLPSQSGPPTLSPGQPGFIGPVVAGRTSGAKPASFVQSSGSTSTDSTIDVGSSPARYSGDSDDLTTVTGALKYQLALLRQTGTNLPDPTSVQSYNPRSQTGTFVQIGPDTVAQHLGRGAYQVASVSRDLSGVMPPLGQPVTISQPPPVASLPVAPVVTREPTHSYGRMI